MDINTHTVHIDGLLNAQALGEVEETVKALAVNTGDIVVIDCTEMSYICALACA